MSVDALELLSRAALDLRSFVDGLLEGLEPNLPKTTQANVRGIVAAVAELRAERDAYKAQLVAARAELADSVRLATPAGIGSLIIEFAKPGPIGLTAPQRAEVMAEFDRLRAELAALREASPPSPELASHDDWTIDDWTIKDGRSNSSDEFVELVEFVGEIIRSSAYDLIAGRADLVGRLIMAQLVHTKGLSPRVPPTLAASRGASPPSPKPYRPNGGPCRACGETTPPGKHYCDESCALAGDT